MLSPSPVNGWNAEGTPCLFINAVQVWYGSDMVCCMTVYGKVWYMVKYVIVNDEMVYVMVAMVYDKVWYAVGTSSLSVNVVQQRALSQNVKMP